MFNTEFTRALHLFQSLARPIQSTSPHPTSPRSILILSTHLRLGLPSGLNLLKTELIHLKTYILGGAKLNSYCESESLAFWTLSIINHGKLDLSTLLGLLDKANINHCTRINYA
jgi:hypothetical protein